MKEYRTNCGEGEYILDGRTLHHGVFNTEWIDWSPKVILDVGAYDWGDSIKFKQAFPSCEVYGFELLKSNYDKFGEFAREKGVITHCVAISDNVGESEFYESRHVNGVNAQSSLLQPAEEYENNYRHIVSHVKSDVLVKTDTIESFCFSNSISNIDVLTIDTEGNEFNVLKGLGKFRPRMVFAEFLLRNGWKNCHNFEETIDFLDGLGYNLVGKYDFDRLFILKEYCV